MTPPSKEFAPVTRLRPNFTIMCATSEELDALRAVLPPCRRTAISACSYELYVGPGFYLMQPGIGKLNAAMATTLACAVLRSSAIIFSGVAGSLDPSIAPGDLIIGTGFAIVDYGLMADGRLRPVIYGELPIDATQPLTMTKVLTRWGDRNHLEIVEMARRSIAPDDPERISLGEILSADYFLNCMASRKNLIERFPEALAFDMESAVVTLLAERFHVPSFVVRTISDSADHSSHADYLSLATKAAQNSADAIPAFLEILAQTS